MVTRCSWANSDPLYEKYHDDEWGVPQHDEHRLFEMITLEGAQAGLSWITVLRKRENYRKAFAGFDPVKIARFDQAKIDKLMGDEGLIRHRGKLESTVGNARVFLDVQKTAGSFDQFIWSFVGGKPILGDGTPRATSRESDAMSKELKKLGFKFVGSTISYAFMQACGLVNDHQPGCFKRKR
jgi:DNA-3-methyladenine glycosylase I